MKRIILLLTAAAFLISVPFASARDANKDETIRLMNERTVAAKKAALKAKEQELAAAATAAKETTKPVKKKAKEKK